MALPYLQRTSASCEFDDHLRHPYHILCLIHCHTQKFSLWYQVMMIDEFFMLAGILLCHTPSPKWT